jgi:hypothetical protein
MYQADTRDEYPSDAASLPPPPFIALVLVLGVLVCIAYAVYYILWETMIGTFDTPGLIQLFHKVMSSSSVPKSLSDEISTVITPHPVSILVLVVLVAGYPYYSPYVWATSRWLWLTITGKRLPDSATSEAFLVSPPSDPGITDWVITRRELLDRLRRRTFRLNPPHGIRCGTSQRRNVPHWEPSHKMIQLYIQRIANTYLTNTDTDTKASMDANVNTAIRGFRQLCEERSILHDIILQMEVDPTIRYSYRRAREYLQPLIAFYDREHHNQRSVDDILGISLGQRDPYNETEDNILNGRRHTLPTQTNDVSDLDKMGIRELRGGNHAAPIAPHLRMDS